MPSQFLIEGGFRFGLRARELSRINGDGSATPLRLGSRAADILLLFLQRPGDLITKNEIMSAVWPNMAVEDSNLPVQIAALRRVLDLDRAGMSAIATVSGRGYRFTLRVEKRDDEAPPVQAAAAAPRDFRFVFEARLQSAGALSRDGALKEPRPLDLEVTDAASGASIWTGQLDGAAADGADVSRQLAPLLATLTAAVMQAAASRHASLPVSRAHSA